MDWNLVFNPVYCEPLMSLVEPSVAIVTARSSRVVTWERAPSAVCSRPTPFDAFCCDWVSAAMLDVMPLAMERPAGSSAPLLIFKPVDNSVRVFCSEVCVLFKAVSAVRSEMLFRTDIDMLCSFGFANLRLRSDIVCGPHGGGAGSSRREGRFGQKPYRPSE